MSEAAQFAQEFVGHGRDAGDDDETIFSVAMFARVTGAITEEPKPEHAHEWRDYHDGYEVCSPCPEGDSVGMRFRKPPTPEEQYTEIDNILSEVPA